MKSDIEEKTMVFTKIGENGQITIPYEVIKYLNLNQGDYVVFNHEGNKIIIDKFRNQSYIENKNANNLANKSVNTSIQYDYYLPLGLMKGNSSFLEDSPEIIREQ